VTTAADDREKLAEQLYYGKQDVVLRIETGFSNKAENGTSAINLTQSPGSYDGTYLKQQINRFLSGVLFYHSLGYSISDSAKRVTAQTESRVTLENINGNGGTTANYVWLFRYFPYLFIAALGVTLGKILVTFRQRNIKNRMLAAPLSLARQNAEIILAFLLLGTALYIISTLAAFLLYGKDLYTSSNLGYYLLNSYVDLLTALEIAFLIGLLVKKDTAVDMFITPLSLGICFLCGVFVPQNILSTPVKTVASFFPMYWYEKVNDLLGDYADISGAIGKQVWQGISIQVLFVFALAGIGMAIARYQQQEQ
jgi:ABC-2 type transport system permease protein